MKKLNVKLHHQLILDLMNNDENKHTCTILKPSHTISMGVYTKLSEHNC